LNKKITALCPFDDYAWMYSQSKLHFNAKSTAMNMKTFKY